MQGVALEKNQCYDLALASLVRASLQIAGDVPSLAWCGVKMQGKVFVGCYCTLDNVHPEMITLEDGVFVWANSVILTHDNYDPRALGTAVSEPKPVHLKKKAPGLGLERLSS